MAEAEIEWRSVVCPITRFPLQATTWKSYNSRGRARQEHPSLQTLKNQLYIIEV